MEPIARRGAGGEPVTSEPTLWSSLTVHLHYARTLRGMSIRYQRDLCRCCRQCIEVCPVGCWSVGTLGSWASFHDAERCIACGACVLQCPEGAIELSSASGDETPRLA